MRLFNTLYERVMGWASHRHALWYLSGLSFVEAFIFPVPPEVLMTPMALARPRRGFRYAHVCLAFSILGSFVGYLLGHYAYQALTPVLAELHWLEPIQQVVDSLRREMNTHWWDMMLVLILAAVQPFIPMKVVTWASGIVGVPVIGFIVCIAIGRGKRVYFLALLIRLFGERAEAIMHRYIDRLGWVILCVLAALVGAWFVWH